MIDWTKPIETVPDTWNPKPVPCEVVQVRHGSHADARFLAPVIDNRSHSRKPLHPGVAWRYYPDGTANDWLPRLRNVVEPAKVSVLDHHDKLVPLASLSGAEAARLNLDMEPIVLAEAPVLLRHHLALAARIFEVLPAGADVDALVDGMEEPGKSAALAWLAALLKFYDLEEDW